MSTKPPIAIVGIGGIFPGARDLDQFWEAIAAGRSAVREVPEGRWILDRDDAFDPEIGAVDKVYSERACFVDELPRKSAMGLDLDPDLLSGLDPAFHLLLHAGHQAFRDAATANLDRARVGVIIGNIALPTDQSSRIARDYLGRTLEEKILGQSRVNGAQGPEGLNRYVAGLPAGVLAKALGLGGGSVALDAACASSLYALKLAVDELQAGRADAMLTGGLSRPDSLYTQMGFSQLRALSPSGRCSPFDAAGDGLVVGEGAGIVMLKRLDDALRDEDIIYAVIRGIGLSNDVGGSLLAPMSEGQLRAMRAAYKQAGWSPQEVDLIECHATGTPLGDAVEVESLRNLWGGEHWDAGQCVIGSVKSNIGHLLTAAGSAALIKVLLALKHKTLPPTANFRQAPPTIPLAGSPFEVLTRCKPWAQRDRALPRRAAVSAFGFGGINAHVLLEEWTSEPSQRTAIEVVPSATENTPVPAIAIVGMDTWFGPWDSLRAFQERVLGGGKDYAPEAPRHWWGVEESAWFKLQDLGRFPFKGHFIGDVDMPADVFRIPPRELEEMLPQQLLMLRVAARALADAGFRNEKSNGSEQRPNAGVFIGLGLDLNTTNFSFRWSLAKKAREWALRLGLKLSEDELSAWTESLRTAASPALTANRTMGALGSIVASRIAREFRFGGPSFAVAAEEGSGIRALEMAVRALQQGTLDQAIAGAVDVAGDVRSVLATHRGRAFSATSTARPFDERADGTVIGEGAAAVVLKREADAIRDGDRVYAVIRGIGVASGGGVEEHVPDERAYRNALERAYAESGIDPASVGYVETHGSGYSDEDRMEASALTKFFKTRGESLPVSIGSAKADVGHTGAASALAGLVKAALCLYQEILPPLRHLGQLRAEMAAQGHRIRPLRNPQYWIRDRVLGPRRAAVSAFGVDGNCSHVVLEAFERNPELTVQRERLQPLGARREALFAIEANNVHALEVALGRLRSHVEHRAEASIEALARAWWSENRDSPSRPLAVALVARSAGELLDQIEFVQRALAENPDKRLGGGEPGSVPPSLRDRVFFAPDPVGAKGKVGLVFPGSGNQYLGMGREISAQWPEVFRKQDHENARLRSQVQPDLFWNSDSTQEINSNHKAVLFGQVTLGTAVSDLVLSFGVQPGAVIGYSLGETAGLFALKAWTDRDLMLKRINESTLFTEDLAGNYNAVRKAWKVPSNKTVDWALGVIDRPAKVVRALLKDQKKVFTLIVNTAHECVVGGDPYLLEALVKKLDCEFFPLHGVTTVHCEVAKEVQVPYRELHVLPTTPPRDVKFYSGAWGTAYNVSRESAADSVLAQAIYGIDYPKLIDAAYDDGIRVFLEMGPGASCTRMIGEILKDRPHLAKSACYQGQDAVSALLRFMGRAIAERVPMDLSVLYGQETTVLEHQEPAPKANTVRIVLGGKPFSVVLPAARPVVADAPPFEALPVADTPVDPVPSFVDIPTPVPTFHEPARALEYAATAAPGEVWLQQWEQSLRMKTEAHASYLRFAESTAKALTDAMHLQISLIQSLQSGGGAHASPPPPVAPPPSVSPVSPAALHVDAPLYGKDLCQELATGSLARVFGPEFAEVDTHPTRVRLPDGPLMLVDRIMSLQGTPRSLGSGRMVTEHDIVAGAWYLDAGRIPTCIAVEAGQADLVLSGYLGIDFHTRGLAVYRLLDAVVTFHDSLPRPGATIRYDIRVERFFRQGDTHLFRFNFDATVDDKPLLTMRNGCAGFFTQEELDSGQGIVRTKFDTRSLPGVRPEDWEEWTPMARESYSDVQLTALRAGRLAECFGPAFAGLNLANPPGLPGGQMKLIDRVLEIDPTGGRFGLGLIRGEMDVFPNDWFLTCHFVDDRVMPGTLMYECCMHTLRVFLMRMGWVGEATDFVYEPVPGIGSELKCRGQVIESTEKVVYEVAIKEQGYGPDPYAIADALMYADGKPIVQITNMSIRLTGLTREALRKTWGTANRSAGPRRALYDDASITAFAVGKPSEAFGDRYTIFDRERVIARLPGPPYKYLDRVVEISGEPWKMVAGGTIEAEYDVPADAWYFDSERTGRMPFAVLLEAALQPCGWFAAYMGSALTSPADLRFRNLGGSAIQHRAVVPDTGTLVTRIRCTNISNSGGMIIQNYDMAVHDAHGPVYTGDTYFGYFSADALATQIGIRDAKVYQPNDSELSISSTFSYPESAPYPDRTLRMVDRVEAFNPKGGPAGLGYVRGSIDVDSEAWFFKAHFFQDPVWPGSLGLEGFQQLLKLVAVERWGVGTAPRIESVALGERHTWVYRGQVLPKDRRVTMSACVTRVDDERRIAWAEGHLIVDGRVIYHMKDFSVRLIEP